MNRERAKELLPIIQAFAEGKTVQHRSGENLQWITVDEVASFDMFELDWRIKPEPREFWIIEDGDHTLKATHSYGAATNYCGEIIKVREVIE